MKLTCVFLAACFCLLHCDGQLTQSLGWGSAGSPGKRSLRHNEFSCAYDPNVLADVLLIIQVSTRTCMHVERLNSVQIHEIERTRECSMKKKSAKTGTRSVPAFFRDKHRTKRNHKCLHGTSFR